MDGTVQTMDNGSPIKCAGNWRPQIRRLFVMNIIVLWVVIDPLFVALLCIREIIQPYYDQIVVNIIVFVLFFQQITKSI